MTEEHDTRTYYWECILCDSSRHFESEVALQMHLTEIHSEAVAAPDLPIFLSVSRKPKIFSGMSCPLCTFVGSVDASGYEKDHSGQELLDHIAQHIHSFALNSLPSADEEFFRLNDYFAESDGQSTTISRKARSEGEGVDDGLSSLHFESDTADELTGKPFQPGTHALDRDNLKEWNELYPRRNQDDVTLHWRASVTVNRANCSSIPRSRSD